MKYAMLLSSKKLIFCFTIFSLIIQNKAASQIIPDNSLGPEQSEVQTSGTSIQIEGGAQRGSNIFHSFEEFSVNANENVNFNQIAEIRNIFSRVVGSNPSNLRGRISSVTNANLFFINPNGIVFGPNSRLDIGGSFLASTSNSFTLNSSNASFDFLAERNIPNDFIDFNSLDVRFTERSGDIRVNNVGTNFSQIDPFSPFPLNTTSGLRVTPNNFIALFGSVINSDGGVLESPSGNLIVASIAEGSTIIERANNDFRFIFSDILIPANINFDNSTLLESNGEGEINIVGNNIEILNGSLINIRNISGQFGGELNIQSNSLNVSGVIADPFMRSGVASETLGNSIAPDINITTQDLSVVDGGVIGIRNLFGSGGRGTVNIDATGTVSIEDSFSLIPGAFSSISAISLGTKSSSDINISARNLFISNGGSASTGTFGLGDGGDIEINVIESITVTGFEPGFFTNSIISDASFGPGTAGDITINTNKLTISEGGIIGTSALSDGDAGNIAIVANEINVIGSVASGLDTFVTTTSIDSSALVNPAVQDIFGLPAVPTGASGEVNIRTTSLNLSNGANISVSNLGPNTAGNLEIISNSVSLSEGSFISAETNDGPGGNLNINSDLLQLFGQSQITATASGLGAGGNINLLTDLMILDNSFITANSNQSFGGQVAIDTQGIFISDNSIISASSNLGEEFIGSISVNTPNVDISKAATSIEAPQELPKIAVSCNRTGEAGELTVAGSAGQPIASNDYTESRLKFYEQGKVDGKPLMITDPVTGEDEIFERFVGWAINPDGKTLRLVSDPSEAIQFQSAKTACLKESQSA